MERGSAGEMQNLLTRFSKKFDLFLRSVLKIEGEFSSFLDPDGDGIWVVDKQRKAKHHVTHYQLQEYIRAVGNTVSMEYDEEKIREIIKDRLKQTGSSGQKD